METKPARVRILDAAHELMLTVGLARATTKEIARAAGCSEAALYKYFDSKEELFVRVLTERLPRLTPLLDSLAAAPGRGTLEENLTEIARQAALFYEQSFPIAASLYAETQLKRRHDDTLRTMGSGPHLPLQGLDAYLRAEQAAGRVPPRRRHLRRRLPARGRLRAARSPTTPPRAANARPWTRSPPGSRAPCWAESPLRTGPDSCDHPAMRYRPCG